MLRSPIVYLDTFLDDAKPNDVPQVCLLAVHANGDVRCFSERLEEEIWSTTNGAVATDDNESMALHVEHACTMHLAQAQKSLLQGMQDLQVTTSQADQHGDATVLVLFTRQLIDKDQSLSIRAMTVEGHNHVTKMGRGKPLQEIACSTIPEPERMKQARSHLSFHPSSGTLYQVNGNYMAVYGVRGMVIHVLHDIKLDLNDVASSLRVSPSLVMISTASSISIIDTVYCSIRAHRSTASLSKAESSNCSRKGVRRDIGLGSAQLLSYFPSLDVVVAQHSRQLIAFQLLSSTNRGNLSRKRKRKRDVLLADSIACGSLSATKMKSTRWAAAKDSHSFARPLVQDPASSTWEKTKALLDQHIADGTKEEIEETLVKELGVLNAGEVGDASAPSALFPKVDRLEQYKAEYLLGKVFSLEAAQPTSASNVISSQRTLKANIFHPHISRWLIQECYVSDDQVGTALRRKGVLATQESLRPGAVLEALAECDASLEKPLSLLQSLTPLTAAEVISALRLVISQCGKDSSIMSLTYRQTPSSHSSEATMGLMTPNHDRRPRDKSVLSNMDAVDGNVLREVVLVSIRRLSTHSPRAVTKALTQVLSRSELHTLVDLLRLELAGNGWLASYFDSQFLSSVRERADITQISAIAHLFSCVIDSIGSGGWIAHNSVAEDLMEAVETIAHMKAEISAALEGIVEATYLRGMLGEMLLCGKNHGSTESKMQKQLTSKVPEHRKPSDIVSVGLEEDNILPLGLKPSRTISTHKVGAGGELIKRSARDIGRLKSKMVPKYSLEKIMI